MSNHKPFNARRWILRHPLEAWAIYRRWGSRSSWVRYDLIDVDVHPVRDTGHWYGEGWATCRCGKVYRCWAGDDSEELVRLKLKLGAMSLCQACGHWSARRSNYCVESGCTLSYDHTGRCKPIEQSLIQEALKG